ncbi:OprD family porin [Pseudomonas baltica]|uniref:OprD family porin n=1 Tax=Pseudomonas baltica TaxID=2762576 RepID=UPI002898DD42|nr:OprD family porin [Pseudomonas baltica]
MRMIKSVHLGMFGTLGLLATAPAVAAVVADQSSSKGFIADSTASLLLRNYYFNREFRDGASNNFGSSRSGYRQEWAQGFFGTYKSGFTEGTVGFGVDALGKFGLKLDGGGGHTGTWLLPINGERKSDSNYFGGGGSIKARISKTQIAYGDVIPTNPVFFSDIGGRLFPQIARGWQILSSDVPQAELEAGRFTSGMAGSRTAHDILRSSYGAREISMFQYAGGAYNLSKAWDASFYAAEAQDMWRQYYFGTNYTLPLAPKQKLHFSFNAYRSLDTGEALAGKIKGTIASFGMSYTYAAHTFSAAIQKNDSNTPFDYVGFADGKSSISSMLAMPMLVDEFQGPNEKVWQLRYDLDLATYGIPGLSFSVRYQSGRGDSNGVDPTGDYAHLYGGKTRHWERDTDIKYVVQSGPVKNLNIRLRHAMSRENSAQPLKDIDEVRIILEYPIKLF